MKNLLLLLAFLASIGAINAQVCTPDPAFATASFGFYPGHFNEVTNPGGGITECATIGYPYHFTLTVVPRHTAQFTDLFVEEIDSIQITDVTGLPNGISYNCPNSSCIFAADSVGCIHLSGLPVSENNLGPHVLLIKGILYRSGGVVTEFTDLDLLIPSGSVPYVLIVNGTPSNPCILSGTHDETTSVPAFTLSPNPAKDELSVSFNQSDWPNIREIILLEVASGKTILSKEMEYQQQIILQTQGISNGFYSLIAKDAFGVVVGVKKVMIQR